MSGSGRVPKDAQQRHGRGGKAETEVSTATTVIVPAWPLRDDVAYRAKIGVLEDIVDSLDQQIKDETDGRKLGGLRRQYQSATNALAVLKQTLIESTLLELEIWRGLWALPHAEQWLHQGYTREVALYARHQARAECGSMDDSKEARQRSDRLGLSPKAFAVLGWKVPTPSPASSPKGDGNVRDIASRRSRLTG